MQCYDYYKTRFVFVGFAIVVMLGLSKANADFTFGIPTNLGPLINTSYADYSPSMSANGLALFFCSERPGGYGDADLWVTRRPTTNDDWGEPINLGPTVNSMDWEGDPDVSSDGSTLLFTSDRPEGYGSWDVWQIPIIPILDFNADGIVDSADMCIIIDHWHENYTLCDIGPTPLGDGIVDVQDLIVLAEHLFEEIFPTELVAYWKLDEIEGNIAYDSAGTNDAILFGEPVWQPEGGMISGALQFDGIEDYADAGFVLNPSDGPFSVFAWVKDGAPGQAIISQLNGANWLRADSELGWLMTELCAWGRSGVPLQTEMEITDGAWYRIGLVWNKLNKSLYVNDILVAEDTQQGLASSIGGLNIGCGTDSTAGTFWSGMIDDVRIYSRAIHP